MPLTLVSAFPAPGPAPVPAWTLPDLSGRLVELSAGADAARLTAAFGLVIDAQLRGDRAAWVTLESSVFFPPDAIESGIDLDALPIVRVPDVRLAGRAADHLTRSGGFGLVVVDLSGMEHADVPAPLLTRLLGLARRQDVAVLILTKKSHESSSIHSLISLRADARWRIASGRYEVCVRVLKDKRSGPGWTHVEMCRGAVGLR